MVAQAGDVVVEIRAESAKFDQAMSRARTETNRFDKQANRTASGAARKLGTEMKRGAVEAKRYQSALAKASDTAGFMTGPLGGVASRISIVSRAASSGGLAMLGLATGVAAVTAGLGAAIREAERMETSFFRTEAILRATGSASGFTANEIRGLSREIALATLASTEGVERAAQKLLTFRSVQGDTFKEALELSQDLAAVGFGTVETAAVQLGKALEDPEKGLSALRRVGVSFSAVQKQQIADFVEAGKAAEAQGLILGALRQQVGGAGRAEAGGLAGAYDTLSQRVSEFLESVGNSGPLQIATVGINNLATSIKFLNDLLFDTDEERLEKLFRTRELAFRPEAVGAINEEIAAVLRRINTEKKRKEAAKEAAAAAREQQDEDRKLGIELEMQKVRAEAAAKAAKRLAEERRKAFEDLRSEIGILQELSSTQDDSTTTIEQLAQQREILATVSRLNLDINSEEAQQLGDLIRRRDELAAVIERESEARQQFADTQRDIREETNAINQQIAAFGQADAAVEAFAMKQQLLNEATAAFGEVSADQRASIDELVDAYATASAELTRLEENQKLVDDAMQQFESTASSALADVVTGTKSLSDAFADLVLSISRAVIEAQALQLVQSVTGGGGGGGGVAQFIGAAFGAGFSGGGAAASTGSTLTAFQASRLHQGGIVGNAGQTINVPASTFIGAPRFHNGLKPDEFPAILQRGEEVVPRDQVGRRDERTMTQVFNITTPDADSFRKSQRQIARDVKMRTAKS